MGNQSTTPRLNSPCSALAGHSPLSKIIFCVFVIPKGFSAFGKGFPCCWQGIFLFFARDFAKFWQGIFLLLARDFPVFRKGFSCYWQGIFGLFSQGIFGLFRKGFWNFGKGFYSFLHFVTTAWLAIVLRREPLRT